MCNCKSCVYRHKYKELKDGKWSISNCCIALTRQMDIADDCDSFVIKVDLYDKCELYRHRRYNNE